MNNEKFKELAPETTDGFLSLFWKSMNSLRVSKFAGPPFFGSGGFVDCQVVSDMVDIGVAIPVLFVGLVVLGIKALAGVVAASVAFVVAVSLSHLPNRIGLLIGALAGVLMAALVPLPEDAA